jgi:membrane-bound lytic murein transglycosylase D
MTRRTAFVLRMIAVIAAVTALFPTAATHTAFAEADAPLNVCTRFYTVRRGDTLTKLARRFGTTPAKVMMLNGMTDPALVRGRLLCVRARADVVGPVTVMITVQDGETLSTIAERYGTSSAVLRKLNRLRVVNPGQQLLVPVRRIKARGV